MKNVFSAKLRRHSSLRVLTLAALALVPTRVTQAADIFWTGGAASYNNPANWSAGTIPGTSDTAINTNGLGNVVQIGVADPAWTINDLSAGGITNGAGAFVQNGSDVTVNSWMILGSGTDAVGNYTLNNGNLNVRTGRLFLGDHPGSISTLNINGGVLNKAGEVFVLADGGWNGSGVRTGIVNQAGGTVNSSSEIWIGQVSPGVGIYNLSGGAINSSNWFVVARSGSDGTLNMTGGSILQASGGQPAFIVGDGGRGTLNHSAGTIATTAGEFWIANGGAAFGTNNMSGTAVLNVNNWIAIGRGGVGELNLSGNAVITKTGAGNIVAPGSGLGVINQSGGTFNVTSGQIWLPENGYGAWNLSGGSATVGVIRICVINGSQGTLNLEGGVLTAAEIAGNMNAGSVLNLNGGVLKPAANSGNFIHDVQAAYVSAGGAIIDTAGFDVTVPQALVDNGGGSLTKNGAGTLTLTGANTYGGPTTINAGKVMSSTASSASGDVTVANNAGFGVRVNVSGASAVVNNLTLSGPTAASLDFSLGGFGNPTVAPLNVLGNFDVNGTVTVNIASDLPQVGAIPLVQFGSRSGAGNFVLGTLPVGISASIVTNGNTIELNITSVNLPRWDGQAGGTWDIGATANWVNIGSGSPTTYGQGNAVLFDDNAAGTTTVNVTTTVNPSSFTVSNTNLPYAFVGTGRISGSTGLTKSGTNTLAILNTGGNNFTGPTIVSNGILVVTNLANGGVASAIGASSASPTNLVLANATFTYAGPTVSINRGYRMAASSVLDVQGDLTLSGLAQATAGTLAKIGPAKLTYAGVGTNVLTPAGGGGAYQIKSGTVVFDGSSGAQTNAVVGEMWVASTTNSAAQLVLTNTTLGVSSWFALGRGNGNSNFVSTANLYNSTFNVSYANTGSGGAGSGGGFSLGYNNGLANAATQTFSLFGTSSLINLGGNFNIAESPGSSAVLNVNHGATITSIYSRNYIGNANAKAVINLNSTNTSTFSTTFGQLFLGGVGGTTDAGVGAINQTAGTVRFGNGTAVYIHLGFNGGTAPTAYGSYHLSGGTLSLSSGDGIRIGHGGYGSFVQSGGTLLSGRFLAIGANTAGGNGAATFTGGTAGIFNPAYRVLLPDAANATGVFNLGTLAGGTAIFTNLYNSGGNSFILQNAAGGNGTLNLNSGTLVLSGAIHRNNTSGGSAVVNLNGGTLQAGANNITLINNTLSSVNVFKGGLTVNSAGNDVTISGNLTTTAGNGLYPAGGTIAVPSGGVGYVGAPLVTVTGGSGSGATAIATVSGGVVTAVVLTSPGQNYQAGDVVNFNFLGGGATTAAPTFAYAVQPGDVAVNVGGGLTKQGNGTLYVNGANTYTGNTAVNAGRLAGTGTIAGPVTVAAAGSIGAGTTAIGTLTVNNALTLAAGSTAYFKLTPASNDQIAGLTSVNYNNAALVVTNTSAAPLNPGSTFKLFNSATPGAGNFVSVTILPSGSGTFDPATGQLTIAGGAPVLNPPVVSGGNLILTGTGSAGSSYTVLTSTNVALPMSAWTTNVIGTVNGSGVISNAIPVSASEPARFFRLQTP